jgi:sarcosine oxidase subunit beta
MTSSLPSVAIVGAGVTGLSIAFELSSRGADVVVYERAGIGAGASGVQPGGIRQQWGTRVNCLLARESLLFYRQLADRLDAPHLASPTPCGYVLWTLRCSIYRRAALAWRAGNVRFDSSE